MRRCLCAVLLSCILGLGSLTAGDLTTAQAQQLVSAAESAVPGGKPVEVSLAIGGKTVAFTVVRDVVGNVTARPVPGPDSAGITISQVSIQMKADAKGVLVPTSMVVVTSSQTIVSYSVHLNPDGTVANLHQAGVGGAGSGGTAGVAKAKPVVGGIGGPGQTLGSGVKDLPKDRYPGFTSGQLPLPAGAGTNDVSASHP